MGRGFTYSPFLFRLQTEWNSLWEYSHCRRSGQGWTWHVTVKLKNYRFLMDCPLWLKICEFWILTGYWVIYYMQVPGHYTMNCRHLKVLLITRRQGRIKNITIQYRRKYSILITFLKPFQKLFFFQIIFVSTYTGSYMVSLWWWGCLWSGLCNKLSSCPM